MTKSMSYLWHIKTWLGHKHCTGTKTIVVRGLQICNRSVVQTYYQANGYLSGLSRSNVIFIFLMNRFHLLFTGFFTFRKLKWKSNSDSIHNKHVVDRYDEGEISFGVQPHGTKNNGCWSQVRRLFLCLSHCVFKCSGLYHVCHKYFFYLLGSFMFFFVLKANWVSSLLQLLVNYQKSLQQFTVISSWPAFVGGLNIRELKQPGLSGLSWLPEGWGGKYYMHDVFYFLDNLFSFFLFWRYNTC